MPLSQPQRLLRASAVIVLMPDGCEVVIPPPSLQQAADCLRLDPSKDAPAESPKERIIRLHRQAQILLGPAHAGLTGELTMEQVAEIVQALYLAAAGINPTAFVEHQKSLRERRSTEEILGEVEDLIIDLAAELHQLPATTAQMPVADAVSLRKRLGQYAREAARFDAALHDKKLS